MGRPAVDEAMALLRERCSDGPLDEQLEFEAKAWCGGLRGVPDTKVLAAARSWPGPAFPKITEFMVHLSEVSSAAQRQAAPASPAGPSQAELSGMSRKERSLERVRAIRADFDRQSAERARPEEAC